MPLIDFTVHSNRKGLTVKYVITFVGGFVLAVLVFATPPLRPVETPRNSAAMAGESTGADALAPCANCPSRRCEPGTRAWRGPCGAEGASLRGCVPQPGCRNNSGCGSPASTPGPEVLHKAMQHRRQNSAAAEMFAEESQGQ